MVRGILQDTMPLFVFCGRYACIQCVKWKTSPAVAWSLKGFEWGWGVEKEIMHCNACINGWEEPAAVCVWGGVWVWVLFWTLRPFNWCNWEKRWLLWHRVITVKTASLNYFLFSNSLWSPHTMNAHVTHQPVCHAHRLVKSHSFSENKLKPLGSSFTLLHVSEGNSINKLFFMCKMQQQYKHSLSKWWKVWYKNRG